MTIGSQGSRPSKNQRREEARQTAREHRAEAQKSERRRRFLVQGGVVTGIIVVVAVIGLVIWSAVPSPGPRPANMASDGIVLKAKLDANGVPTGEIEAVLNKALPDGAAPITTAEDPDLLNIVVYVDYQCPVCKKFSLANSSIIKDRVASGAATIEIHPISILDRASMGSRYSSRAVNAAACLATYDPNKFLSFDDAMFTNQPGEGTAGLDNASLKEIIKSVGADRQAEIGTCIDNETFKSWVTSSWNRVREAVALPNTTDVRFEGTPTVFVNGTKFEGARDAEGNWYPAQFSDFLLKLEGLKESATSTPAPSN